MVHASRTFRLFLSSTFDDLVEERNALHEHVFPSLQRLAMAHGARFQVVDLRWGVTDEAAFDQRTVAICLKEIERCKSSGLKPDFLILLGDRYGWRPLPNEIKVETFHAIESLNAGGLLSVWYRRDDNALPAAYYLKPRTDEWREAGAWRDVERKLLDIFEAAEPALAANGDRNGWGLSATEMEIRLGVLDSPDACRDLHCFARVIRDAPRDLRNSRYFDRDVSAKARLFKLRDELSRRLGEANYHQYSVRWTGESIDKSYLSAPGSPEGELNLCREVRVALERTLQRELVSLEEQDPLEQEIHEHAIFAEQRTASFTGRGDILARIASYLEAPAEKPLVMWGASGCGKSALLGRASLEARGRLGSAQVVSRFIGATPESTSARGLMESIGRELSRKYGWDESTVPAEYRDLMEDFSRRLRRIPEDRPLLLFLDALDQLSAADYGWNVAWLPDSLPAGVRVVVSTLPSPETCYEVLAARNSEHPDHMLEITRIQPEDADAMLRTLLNGAARTLQPGQQSVLLGAFEHCPLPLYLKLIFEEARLWKSHDLAIEPAPQVPGVIRQLFAWLSHPVNHDALIVSRSLGYLAAGKNGLTEDELLSVLSQDSEVMKRVRSLAHHDIREGAPLPAVLWSRLYFDLKAYLNERAADGAAVLSFFHRQFKEIVDSDFLGNGDSLKRHRALSEYMGALDTVVRGDGRASLNVRKLSELSYQQRKAQMWSELEKTLCDLDFIGAKCAAGLTYDLVADYDAALAEPALPSELRLTIEQFARFVRAHSHVLSKHPGLMVQLALNEPDVTAPAQTAQKRLQPGTDLAHFRWINKPQALNRCILTLAGHRDTVNTCGVSPDGKYIISGASDAQIKIWDASSGQEMRTLSHPASVEICLYSPDGSRILAGTRDGHVCLWDAVHYQLLGQQRPHSDAIANAAFSRDGSRFATTSWDRTLGIHDTRTGNLIRRLPQESQVLSCDFHPDGKSILCGTNEGRLRIWDLETQEERAGPAGHQGAIYRCAFSSDARSIFSCSQDGTLKRWDAATLESAGAYTGHRAAVWSFALSPDETQMVSASEDQSLIVWDIKTEAALATLRGHAGAIWGVAYAPDAKTVVSAAWDWTVKVWSLDAAQAETVPTGGPSSVSVPDPPVAGPVICCDVSPDGVYLAAGSADGHLRLWRTKDAALVADIPAHNDYVLVTKFSPDGRYVLSGGFNGSVRLFDLSSRAHVADLGGHQEHILATCFSRDGRILLTGSGTKIQAWDIGLSGARLIASLEQKEPGFSACALAPDGSWAIVGDEGGALEIRAIPSGEVTGLVGRHPELNFAALSTDGARLATVAGDGTLKVWDVAERREIAAVRAHERAIESCNFSADGKSLVTAAWDGVVKVWRCDALDRPTNLVGHVDQLQDACFTPDGARVVSAAMDGTLRLWEANTGAQIGSLLVPGDSATLCAMAPDGRTVVSASHRCAARIWSTSAGSVERVLRGHALDVRSCSFSPDGNYLVTASADRRLKLWDTRTWQEVRTYDGHRGPIWSCAFSPDGQWIVSGSCDGTARIWNLTSGEEQAILEGHEDWVRQVLWSGGHVISCSGRTVRVWNGNSRELEETLTSNASLIQSAAIGTGGSRLICGMGDGTIGVCDLGSGSPMIPLSGHSAEVRCCGISPDGLLAYSGSMDRTLRIWDMRERSLRHTLIGHEHWVLAGAFSPTGGLLFSSSQDHYMKVWDARAGTQVCEYWVGFPALCISIDSHSRKVAVGDGIGQIHILELVSAAAW